MEENFLAIAGNYYYVDLGSIYDAIKLKRTIPDPPKGESEEVATTAPEESAVEIDVSKYEVVKLMLEVIMSPEEEEVDNKMGVKAMEKLSVPFKLAFNTLIFHGILKEVDL